VYLTGEADPRAPTADHPIEEAMVVDDHYLPPLLLREALIEGLTDPVGGVVREREEEEPLVLAQFVCEPPRLHGRDRRLS
jgi:hypothetical protein